jgi:hypothetical protein
MPVKARTGFDLPVKTVGDLRALDKLPYPESNLAERAESISTFALA